MRIKVDATKCIGAGLCVVAAPQVFETIKTLDGKCADIYREHPFYKPPDLAQMVRQLVESPDLKRSTDLS